MFWCFYVSATFVQYLSNNKSETQASNRPYCVSVRKASYCEKLLWKFAQLFLLSAGILFMYLDRHGNKRDSSTQQQSEHNTETERASELVWYRFKPNVHCTRERISHLSRDWHDEIDKQRPPQTMIFCHGNTDRRRWSLAVEASMYCWCSPVYEREEREIR